MANTYRSQGRKAIVNDLNPKSVTNDELFGVINSATREWKDGLFSSLMREQARAAGDDPKWIIMDGDIDPMWIESLNTVMDDNKVLTLASNERIALSNEMRLIFEVGHLRCATPATVSRGSKTVNTSHHRKRQMYFSSFSWHLVHKRWRPGMVSVSKQFQIKNI